MDRRTASGIQISEGEAGLAGATGRCSTELAVGFGRGASAGDQGSVSAAGDLQKKRKAVRKESADTQEDEACHFDDVDVDVGRGRGRGSVELRAKCGKQFGWMA